MFRLFLQKSLPQMAKNPNVWIAGTVSGYTIHTFFKDKREREERVNKMVADIKKQRLVSCR